MCMKSTEACCAVDINDVFIVSVVAIGYGTVLRMAVCRRSVATQPGPLPAFVYQSRFFCSNNTTDRGELQKVRLIWAQVLVQGQGLNSVKGFLLAES